MARMAGPHETTVQARARRKVRQRHEKMLLAGIIIGVLVLAGSLAVFHQPSASSSVAEPPRNNLAAMARIDLRLGSATFDLWLARTEIERELGLMQVRPDELTDNQGMLFVFDDDQVSGFWMKNTLIPLDIAFVRHDGTVVDIAQMQPLSLVTHAPREPYRYAIEVKAGRLAKVALRTGDVVAIPADLLNR